MPIDRPLFTDKEGRLILSKDGQLGCCCGGEVVTQLDGSNVPGTLNVNTSGGWTAV